ncbi:MAG TPA: hypothetical protein VMV92_19255 [Streptosporangiaceae bacterium]|nr:hypothetical protein [Streptosporangiaceae bacterium]
MEPRPRHGRPFSLSGVRWPVTGAASVITHRRAEDGGRWEEILTPRRDQAAVA